MAAENLDDILLADLDMGVAALGDAHRRVADHLADLALQVPHAGFPRVEADDRLQRGIVDLDLVVP